MDPTLPPAVAAQAATITTTRVPWGLTSTLGVLGSAAAVFVAALLAVLGGDHSADAMRALGAALVSLLVVLLGRYAQATALSAGAGRLIRTLPPIPDAAPPAAPGLQCLVEDRDVYDPSDGAKAKDDPEEPQFTEDDLDKCVHEGGHAVAFKGTALPEHSELDG